MGTVELRPHDCLKNRLPEDASRSSPPANSGWDTSRQRNTGISCRQSKISRGGQGSPGHRSPPSQTKPSRSRNNNNNNGRGGLVTPVRPGGRSLTPEGRHQMVVKLPVKRLVMEEVTILKRGQELRPAEARQDRRPLDRGEEPVVPAGDGGPDLCSLKLGPESKILPKKIELMDQKPQLYAGAGFLTSPPPSSLPLPTFFTKKDVASTTDLATRGLRYLLRLDLP